MAKDYQFRVSSALKDIIGRDLITDDFIAVFELVKNSFDAYASNVDVCFESINGQDSKIIIKDNGKGMDEQDLIQKWLFVAYSAKREGTEDDSIDYRDIISHNRPFAGAKGIGRFSCDRLGKKLRLETTKKKIGAKTEIIFTDWEQFENDIREEFVKISVQHKTKEKTNPPGTILEISGLRSNWDRQKLLKLKNSLAKLVNPSIAKNHQDFQINLIVPEEIDADSREHNERSKVNGCIRNFIFDDLELKTTKIHTSISEDGKYIFTELRDGDTLIYKIKESNKFKFLKNIDFTLYYLNKSAKLTFARRMGLASRLYGHVFLYKGGFRIYPFGEPYEDPLNIDERKSRKQFSRLGTSELIGQIEISGDNPELKETSSRGDGIIQTPTYSQLKEAFIDVLEKLEKYVVEIQEWGLSIEDDLNNYEGEKLKSKIGDLIKEITDADDIIEFDYSDNFLEILQGVQEDSALEVLKNLQRIAVNSGDKKFISQTNRVDQLLRQYKKAKEIAETEYEARTGELVEQDSEILFLKAIKSQDFDDVLYLMHQIGISTSTIQNYIKGVVHRIDNNDESLKVELKDIIQSIDLEVNRIYSISRFATKANFKAGAKPSRLDLKDFIREYLLNIAKPFMPSGTNLRVLISDSAPFVKEFRPLEVTMLLDNLINNAKKAGASNIEVVMETDIQSSLKILFQDDGTGIAEDIQSRVFDYGYTTTDGSGLGLTHVKKIVDSLDGTISLNCEKNIGTVFTIIINRN